MKPNEYFDRLESCVDDFIERLENVTKKISDNLV